MGEIKKFAVDASDTLTEELLPKELPKVASTARTMQSILEEHAANASISGGVLMFKTDISDEAKAALADDLGQMLIGKKYKNQGRVSVHPSSVTIKLDSVQAE